jgi:hypothetical protein
VIAYAVDEVQPPRGVACRVDGIAIGRFSVPDAADGL